MQWVGPCRIRLARAVLRNWMIAELTFMMHAANHAGGH